MQNDSNFNEFSLLSRLFGNLYYRLPSDSLLANVFVWLQQKGLESAWALETDKTSQAALSTLAMKIDLNTLSQEYQYLFGEMGKIDVRLSHYIHLTDFITFRRNYGIPELNDIDHIATLFLTSAWIEDNLNSAQIQIVFFQDFLLPVAAKWLPQVEQHARLPFYRQLAYLTRELLAAMADELEE